MPLVSESSKEQYIGLKTALLQIKDDSSAVISILASQSDNGLSWINQAYSELRHVLAWGQIDQANEISDLIAVILCAQEGGTDDELSEHRLHKEAVKWLVDGISAILSQDSLLGVHLLKELSVAVYCNESLQWGAWLWLSKAALDIGDLSLAKEATKTLMTLADGLDKEAQGLSLCTQGEMELQTGQIETGMNHLTTACSLFEELKDKRALANALLIKSRCVFAAGDEKEGFSVAEQAQKTDPQLDAPVFFLINQLLLRQRYDEVEKLLNHLAEKNPLPLGFERQKRLFELLQNKKISHSEMVEYLDLKNSLTSLDLIDRLKEFEKKTDNFDEVKELLAWSFLKIGKNEEAVLYFKKFSECNLNFEMQMSLFLGLSCLASRFRRKDSEKKSSSKESLSNIQQGLPKRLHQNAQLEEFRTTAKRSIVERGSKQPYPLGDSNKEAFTGTLKLFAVPDLLEFLRNSRRTGTLHIISGKNKGTLHMHEGMLTGGFSPKCKELGDKNAVKEQIFCAVRELVGWTSGRFSFKPQKEEKDDSEDSAIELDTQSVLLDVLRQMDEESR